MIHVGNFLSENSVVRIPTFPRNLFYGNFENCRIRGAFFGNCGFGIAAVFQNLFQPPFRFPAVEQTAPAESDKAFVQTGDGRGGFFVSVKIVSLHAYKGVFVSSSNFFPSLAP